MPSWGAVKDLRDPLMDPTGVLEAATMTASWEDFGRRRQDKSEQGDEENIPWSGQRGQDERGMRGVL